MRLWDKIRELNQRFVAWLLQERHKTQAKKICGDVEKAFTAHPTETDETYWQHLWFTWSMSVRFAYVSFIIMVHGLFPFLFTRTASLQIEKIYLIMRSRIPKTRRDIINGDDI